MSEPTANLFGRVRDWWQRVRGGGGAGARDRRRWAPYGFLLAVILFLATASAYVVTRRLDVYVQVGAALTLLSVLAGILLDPALVRRALTGRQARYGGNAVLISLAFLGILVVVNYLAYANPLRADLTEDQEFSLSPETLLTLSGLQSPVQIIGFYGSSLRGSQENIRPLLDSYRANSDNLVSYEFMGDPDAEPIAARRYGVTRDGSLVVIIGEASEVVPFPSEEEITSALIRLANPADRKIYFLTGHGERDIEETGEGGVSDVRAALEAKNYEVGTLNLLVETEVPEDALAVIVAGPTFPLTQGEADLLTGYLDGGGSLVLLQQPRAETRFGSAEDPLEAYLAQTWGIALNDDLVIEPGSQNAVWAIAFSYTRHAITTRMQNVVAVLPSARSLTVSPLEDVSLTQTPLAFTSEFAWGETDLSFAETGIAPSQDQEGETSGPLALAAVADNGVTGSRVVVFGDADFAANRFFSQLGNGDLIINSIDYAAGQENLISLTPRPATQRFVIPPSTQALGLIILTTVGLMPGAVVVLGVWVWWQRRRRL
ncbi:MAG TPA: Gldg family protein [Anaerolineales bacterium]|nr:Gldg family protein [Anaerolineales bacterium]